MLNFEQLELEKGTISDLTELIALYRGIYVVKEVHWSEDYPGPEFIKNRIEEGSLYVFRINGEIVASCYIGVNEMYKPFDWRLDISNPVNVSAFCVKMQLQSLGLGKRIITLIAEKAKQLGHNGLRFMVSQDNLRAIHLYESYGVQRVGKVSWYGEQYLMEYKLD